MKKWIRGIKSRIFPQYIRADLHSTLQAANADATLEQKILWLESLVEWMRLPASFTSAAQKTEHIEATRVRFLLQVLERQPELKTKVSQTLQSILVESRSVDLYFAAGIELQQGFVRELFDRVLSRIVPRFREPESLKQTFEMLFASDEDVGWLRYISPKDVEQLANLALSDDVTLATFRAKQLDSLVTALNFLAARMVGLIVEQDLRDRLFLQDVHRSPFFKLQVEISSCRAEGRSGVLSARIRPLIAACQGQIDGVYPILESTGVSVDLVYKLDALKSILRRVTLLTKLHDDLTAQQVTPQECIRFLTELADLHLRRASLAAFLGSSLNLIARKIVERTSETGETYITRTPREYRAMFRSAGGGGIITTFTCAIKAAFLKSGLPLFFEGFFNGLNYAVSFSIIQLCHFTLATKTPAMTASNLAGKLKDLSSPEKTTEFVDEAVAMHRSAFIGVIGNMGLVIPGVIVFDLIWKGLFGVHFFTPTYGLDQLRAHNPFASLTIWYAIVTGFILWLSSILGGWFENWLVYRRIFEVFEHSPNVREYMGEKRQLRLSGFFRRNAAGFGTNIFLGFMLGFCGIIGKFFGVPLDVRHVTLSMGTLTFGISALPSLKTEALAIIFALLGVGFIATLNFAVSFFLSLFVAARARNIRLRDFPFLLRLIMERFMTRTVEFYFAPSTKRVVPLKTGEV